MEITFQPSISQLIIQLVSLSSYWLWWIW